MVPASLTSVSALGLGKAGQKKELGQNSSVLPTWLCGPKREGWTRQATEPCCPSERVGGSKGSREVLPLLWVCTPQ